jgi:hypothetical protein
MIQIMTDDIHNNKVVQIRDYGECLLHEDGSYTIVGCLVSTSISARSRQTIDGRASERKVLKPENNTTTTPAKLLVAAGTGGGLPRKHETPAPAGEGCPVKHQEYNAFHGY